MFVNINPKTNLKNYLYLNRSPMSRLPSAWLDWLKCSQNQCAMRWEMWFQPQRKVSVAFMPFRAMHRGYSSQAPSSFSHPSSLRPSVPRWRNYINRSRSRCCSALAVPCPVPHLVYLWFVKDSDIYLYHHIPYIQNMLALLTDVGAECRIIE